MKTSAFTFLLLLFLFLLPGCSLKEAVSTPSTFEVTPPANMQVVEGKLLNQVTRLENSLPKAGSGGFIIPTDAQKQVFGNIVADLRAGNLEQASVTATDSNYELLWYVDQNDNNSVDFVLREIDPSKNGWGLFVFRADTTSNLIIEAPHPVFDEETPKVSVDLFRALKARAVLVAGAHRDANPGGTADASSNPQTIFEAVHEAELQQSINSTGTGIILQIHGFASSKHPAYPHIIISYEHGANMNPVDLIKGQQLAARLVKSLNDKGIQAGLCDGSQWRDLCGSTNIQSSMMTQGIFIHIELDETIRAKDKKFQEILLSVFSD